MRTVGLVLAAGAGSRFGGDKLAAELEGRPLLAHAIAALAAAPVDRVVVVLRPEASAAVRAAAGDARVVVNDRAADGLATSLRAGLDAVRAEADRVVVALGDQPRLRPEVIRALLDASVANGARPVTVPGYAAGGGRNPVVLSPSAYGLADTATGDAGLGPILAARPELVAIVPVDGDNPDVDTPAALAALASRPDVPR